MGGMMRSETSAVTIFPNAAPTMTPTARSATLPRSANSLNSSKMGIFMAVILSKFKNKPFFRLCQTNMSPRKISRGRARRQMFDPKRNGRLRFVVQPHVNGIKPGLWKFQSLNIDDEITRDEMRVIRQHDRD